MKKKPSYVAFRRVYQGGHHDVYCNGENHITLSGSAFGTAPMGFNTLATLRLNGCDCDKHKEQAFQPNKRGIV